MSKTFNLDNIHPSWQELITSDIKSELELIRAKIGEDFTPSETNVLRFMQLDLNKTKVVILGQDPYPTVGAANGRAFQPEELESWGQKFRQTSLKNIIRGIYKTYNGIENYREIPKYLDILNKIDSGEFKIKQPKEWFDSLEEQGVLLLNTSLTCIPGVSNSHKDIWTQFTLRLIEYIDSEQGAICWFLWGKEAQAYDKLIKHGVRYRSKHPMMCSETYDDDFLKGNCFRDTMDIIDWRG